MNTVTIAGKEYPVEIREGERYINGQTVDKFLETLPFEDLAHFMELGYRLITGQETHPQEDIAEMEFRDY